MSVNKHRNLKKYVLSYTKRLVKLIKIEIGRKRTRTYANNKTVNAPIDASGSLRNSIRFGLKSVGDRKYSFQIKGNSYGEILDKGRESGEDTPSKKDLVKWINDKKLKLKDAQGRFIDMTPKRIDLTARYMVASIRKFGSPATNFLGDAMEIAESKLDNKILRQVFSEDMAKSIEEILIDAGYSKKGDEFIIQK